MNDLTTAASTLEAVILQGDLSKLRPEEKVMYYNSVCESVGLNPLTQPFAYMKLQGKETLYCLKGGADQIRQIHGITLTVTSMEIMEDLFVVKVRATDKTGRTDEDLGALSIANLKGEAKSNAMMKCVTKAKRRVTLSIAGLGMLDETEVETIHTARTYPAQVVIEQKPMSDETYECILTQMATIEVSQDTINAWLERAGVKTIAAMTEEQGQALQKRLQKRIEETFQQEAATQVQRDDEEF